MCKHPEAIEEVVIQTNYSDPIPLALQECVLVFLPAQFFFTPAQFRSCAVFIVNLNRKAYWLCFKAKRKDVSNELRQRSKRGGNARVPTLLVLIAVPHEAQSQQACQCADGKRPTNPFHRKRFFLGCHGESQYKEGCAVTGE